MYLWKSLKSSIVGLKTIICGTDIAMVWKQNKIRKQDYVVVMCATQWHNQLIADCINFKNLLDMFWVEYDWVMTKLQYLVFTDQYQNTQWSIIIVECRFSYLFQIDLKDRLALLKTWLHLTRTVKNLSFRMHKTELVIAILRLLKLYASAGTVHLVYFSKSASI